MTEEQDERFNVFIQETARGYNQPPATPRDEMWSSIVAGRRSRAAEKRAQRRWISWAAGIAAVLAIGVGIGRFTAPTGGNQMASSGGIAGPAATYRAVAGDHFGRVETLLTMFSTEGRNARTDQQVSTTARNLLTTNRLLMDSPVADDPRMKHLLEDLDLVLAQIAQLSAEREMDPTEMIVNALEDNGVLLRLRSAVPAEPVMGTQGAE